jgi:hypothetical protein
VLVHDEGDAGQPLLRGRVTEVRTAVGSNDVAIRVPSTGGTSKVIHPNRLAVHLDEYEPESRCWRCDARADEALRPRQKVATPDDTK